MRYLLGILIAVLAGSMITAKTAKDIRVVMITR